MSAPPPPPRKPRPEPSTPAGPGSVAPPPRRAATTAPSTAQSAAPAARSGRPAPGRPAPGRPPAESRQNARPASPGRGRTALLSGLAILGVIVIAGAAFLVLRSDSTEKAGPTLHASTSIDLQPGELTVDAVGTPVEFPTDVRDLVLSTLGAYVDHGIVNPLRTGTADDALLATVFDIGAVARLTGTDRALLLDENLPKAAGKVAVTTPPVAMSALVGTDGKVVVVSATVALSVKAQTKKGALEILRSGSLVFAPDDAGGWKITGWTIGTERGGKALGPTTTTTTPTTVAVAP